MRASGQLRSLMPIDSEPAANTCASVRREKSMASHWHAARAGAAAWVYPPRGQYQRRRPERTALYQVVRDTSRRSTPSAPERVAWNWIIEGKGRASRPFLTMTWLTIVRQCC
jgi:hypothetical protein